MSCVNEGDVEDTCPFDIALKRTCTFDASRSHLDPFHPQPNCDCDHRYRVPPRLLLTFFAPKKEKREGETCL